jgi:hypothetical protein
MISMPQKLPPVKPLPNAADGTSAVLSYDLQELSAAIAAEIDQLIRSRGNGSANEDGPDI